jgi:ankyrin repeat protein
LEHRADADAQDSERETSLHLAVDNEKVEAARVLLENGASVHARNKNRQTPFQIASEKGNEEILALLRKHMSRE